VSVLKTMAHCS